MEIQLSLIIVVTVLVGALLFVWWRQRTSRAAASSKRKSRGNGKDGLDTLMSWHPQATRILTVSERKAFLSLRNGLPEHIILAQVPLARFLKVPTRHSYAEWLRRVGVMCADLVVCDSASQVIAVVDVRAPEVQENDRARQRHARMDRVLKAAEIPLHVWREDALPNSITARNTILNMPADTPVPGTTGNVPPMMTQPLNGRRLTPNRYEDEGVEMTEEPVSSTWFDDMDSAAAPLSPVPPPVPRGSGPSIR